MQKVGTARLNGYDLQYYIAYIDNGGIKERLDVFSDSSKYTPNNTSTCYASYVKNAKEHILGDEKFIRSVLKIQHEASMLYVAEQQEAYVEDGKFCMKITKESADGAIYFCRKMAMGQITYEEYKTPAGHVIYDAVNSMNTSFSEPFNMVQYETVGAIKRTVTRSQASSSANFRSEEELLRLYPEVSHVLENDYVVVQSYEEAIERLNKWVTSSIQLKGYDIESLHTDWGPGSDNRITGVFLGLGTTWSTYFPFRQDNFDYNLPIEFLRTIFDAINSQPPAPEVILLGHNMKFEIEGFYQEFGHFIRFDVDTYLLAVLANPKIGKGTHTLKALGAQVENKFYLTLKHIFIGPVKFNVLTPGVVKLYGCPDATTPAKIYPWLLEKIPKDEHYVMQLEMLLPYVKAMNEFYGIRLDMERVAELIAKAEYKVEYLSNLFKKMHNTSKNINAYDTLKEILYDKLRCKVEVFTSKGGPATSKVAIDRIIAGGKIAPDLDRIPADIVDKDGKVIIEGKTLASNKYPSLVIYQTYKKELKELGALRRLRDHSVNGRFKFYINQSGAGSNRQTSDAHQFSDTMKSCALADSPYHGLVSSDWAQVELRILAGMAGETDLIELESQVGVDIHRAILSLIQNKPIHLISEEERQAGKGVNFGVVYMMSEYGLAARDFGPGYTKEQLNIEKEKITNFFNTFPRIKKLLKDNENFLKENGYITTAFKYYRYFPELLDPTTPSKVVKSLIRSGNNTPVQGTGAQLLKISETKVQAWIKEKGWDQLKNYDGVMLPKARMILPIHDEILFSYDMEEITKEEVIYMFKECMELDVKGFPPLFVSPAFIGNWYEGKNPTFEVPIPLRDKIIEEYLKGNYLLKGKDYEQVLDEYRNNEIKEYMQDLIAKYKTASEIAKHVDHPVLTHTLIETMIPKKPERKKFTHLERIEESVIRYMKKLEEGGDLVVKQEVVDTEEEKREFMPADEWVEQYVKVDSFGDVIQEELDLIDDGELDESILEVSFEDQMAPKEPFVYGMNECIIDLSDYDIATTGNDIHQRIVQQCTDDQYYKVIYIVGNLTKDTGMKIDYVPDILTDIFNSVENKEV